jgi:hypothetical protein
MISTVPPDTVHWEGTAFKPHVSELKLSEKYTAGLAMLVPAQARNKAVAMSILFIFTLSKNPF